MEEKIKRDRRRAGRIRDRAARARGPLLPALQHYRRGRRALGPDRATGETTCCGWPRCRRATTGCRRNWKSNWPSSAGRSHRCLPTRPQRDGRRRRRPVLCWRAATSRLSLKVGKRELFEKSLGLWLEKARQKASGPDRARVQLSRPQGCTPATRSIGWSARLWPGTENM